ncbi:MAG: bifunctional adenosylcobinamide kinase/adenosylcobinamide-phosphate guanylyltransferase [Epsilonproteobacteria bacterium]|nr:bifunctional adenosylcobinamide kinase/adenosylcobinamide-phosphate guanylyltransferase [Campylobacterota bacterium]
MKTLYHGGQKSGKSLLAEQKALSLAGEQKPYYIATYDNSYNDVEMAERIAVHQSQRKEQFSTIEETLHLSQHIQEGHTYLIDCMSMWLLNTMEWSMEALLDEVEIICSKEANFVFVLNDVGSGVIPLDAMSRKYVDRSGILGQKLAQLCDEVYEVKLGLENRLK